jgi:hypothetical protein
MGMRIKMKYLLSLSFIAFISVSLFAQNERPEQPDIPGDISVDVGLTFLTNTEQFLESQVWPSRVVGLHYMYSHQLADRFTINPSLGLGMDRFGIQDNVNFQQDSLRSYQLDTISGLTLRKNLLTFTYLELPVELRFYPFKTVQGEGFFIGVGGFAGVNIGAQTKIKYDLENTTRVEREKADFGLNPFRYGLQAHIGWKQFSIFSKVYLNDLFDVQPGGANPKQISFGFNFTGF